MTTLRGANAGAHRAEGGGAGAGGGAGDGGGAGAELWRVAKRPLRRLREALWGG